MNDKLNIAIVSDLHCKYSNGKNASEVFSYLTSDLFPVPIERNPVESLKRVIDDNSLVADLLLCPGDITDKSDKQGLISGWKYLEDLKIAFNSKILAATVGNHDMDSRKLFGTDPTDSLRRFSTKFPTDDNSLNTFFWANHFCLVDSEKCDLLIFNSAYSQLDEKTCNESSISQLILDNIEKSLKTVYGNGKLKIAMCHHHPIKHSNMDYKDGDSINKGDDFLKLLEKYDFSLVVHGHKHDPRLNYLNSLPIFCAGSFSSMTNLLDIGAQNTFHFIEIKKNKRGLIRSWIYGPKDGWTQKSDTYFPCYTGFGVNVKVETLAADCAAWFKKQSQEFISFADLLKEFPDIDYLIPTEQIKLDDFLSEKYSLQFLPKLINRPKALTKMY